jgi:hypothetical protein
MSIRENISKPIMLKVVKVMSYIMWLVSEEKGNNINMCDYHGSGTRAQNYKVYGRRMKRCEVLDQNSRGDMSFKFLPRK